MDKAINELSSKHSDTKYHGNILWLNYLENTSIRNKKHYGNDWNILKLNYHKTIKEFGKDWIISETQV